jgi:hypothetical protein
VDADPAAKVKERKRLENQWMEIIESSKSSSTERMQESLLNSSVSRMEEEEEEEEDEYDTSNAKEGALRHLQVDIRVERRGLHNNPLSRAPISVNPMYM